MENHIGQLIAGIIPEIGEMQVIHLRQNPDFSGVEVIMVGLVIITLDTLGIPVI